MTEINKPSFKNGYDNDNNKAVKRFIDGLRDKNNIITVWGAGASVKSGVPSAKLLLQQIRADLEAVFDSHRYHNALTDIGHYNESSLESNLSLYSKINKGPEALKKWLKKYIPQNIYPNGQPYFPSFAHEFCSHLTKAGLLRFFISMNFDEILEAALVEELGPTCIEVIASRSEFERIQNITNVDDWFFEYKLPKKKCLIFKPHGTISLALTLRNIPENVNEFDNEKEIILRKLMNLDNLLLVFLGFANKDDDFKILVNEIVSQRRKKNIDFIVVDIEPDNVITTIPKGGNAFKYKGNIDDYFIKINEQLFDIPFYSNATRHYLRSLFFDVFSRHNFKDIKTLQDFNEDLENIPGHWLNERIYELELLMYLFSSRGLFIQLAATDCLSVKNAYERCLSTGVGYSKNIQPESVLKGILGSEIFDSSMVIDRFGKEAFNTRWCYLLLDEEINPQNIGNNNDIEEKLNKYCKLVSDKYYNWLENKYTELASHISNYDKIKDNLKIAFNIDKVTESFKHLYHDADVDIKWDDITSIMRFSRAKRIESNEDLIKEAKYLLSQDWNKIQLSSVTAEWLFNELSKLRHNTVKSCCIEIISNMDVFLKKNNHKQSRIFHYVQAIFNIIKNINKIDKNNITIDLSWYLLKDLEHHMAIYSKVQGNTVQSFIGATYFRRIGKNRAISPVITKDRNDIKALFRYFEDRKNYILNDQGDISKIESSKVNGMLLFTAKKVNGILDIEYGKDTQDGDIVSIFRDWIDIRNVII